MEKHCWHLWTPLCVCACAPVPVYVCACGDHGRSAQEFTLVWIVRHVLCMKWVEGLLSFQGVCGANWLRCATGTTEAGHQPHVIGASLHCGCGWVLQSLGDV